MNLMRSKYATRANVYKKGASAKGGRLSLSASLSSMPSQNVIGRMGLWWIVGLTLIWCAFLLTTRPAAAQGFQLFVPSISTNGSTTGSSDGELPVVCGLNEYEQAVADWMVAHEGQQRKNPVCDPILAQVARARARDMALRDYFAHTSPEGDGPNLLARQAGYPLPDWYGDDQGSNNIESIGAGYATPDDEWTAWLNSSKHRTHVLGTQQFYADQDAYGVGYYYSPDSFYKHYWVFLSAPVAGE